MHSKFSLLLSRNSHTGTELYPHVFRSVMHKNDELAFHKGPWWIDGSGLLACV